ncbi:MAG: hypothetical protein FWC74_09160 [Candidatus Bathyarchaeota archaeon]|nr:hypothetical protein [Candidatus Termitimicrobium sp.]
MKYIKNKKTKFLAYMTIALLLASISIAAIPSTRAISSPVLSASSGGVGAKIAVSGTDAQPGSRISVFWENTNPINMLATLYADGLGVYSQEIVIPVAPAGVHYIVIQDLCGTAASAYTIVPELTITSNIGLPNDSIIISGTGFAATANMTIDFDNTSVTPTSLTTDHTGTFIASFKVPNSPHGNYHISASDSINTASISFTIGASILPDMRQGPCGSVVAIFGRGFDAHTETNIDVQINNSLVPQILPIKTNADGTFLGQIIIPTLAVGNYQISASDGTVTAQAPFNVTATSKITLAPKSGAPGIQMVQISGTGFTAKAGTIVTAQIGPLILGTYLTDVNGAFAGTFVTPSLYPDVYQVTVKDIHGLSASTDFQITLTELAVTPTTAVTGATITVTGYGFTGKTANITIGNTTLSTITGPKTPIATLLDGADFIVPTLPVGTYTITATDDDGLTAQTTLAITATTTITLNPAITPLDTKVDLTAKYFEPNTDLYITLKNTTWSTDIHITPKEGFNDAKTNKTGEYSGTFEVPLNWTFGQYTLNITSTNGLTLEVPFTTAPMDINIRTRQQTYIQGESGSFMVTSELPTPGSITITDPTGYILDILPVNLQKTADTYTDAYITFKLPGDAPLGTWTWTAAFSAHGGYTTTSTFTVQPTTHANPNIPTPPNNNTPNNDATNPNLTPDTPNPTDPTETAPSTQPQTTPNPTTSDSNPSTTNPPNTNNEPDNTNTDTTTQETLQANSNVAQPVAQPVQATTSSIAIDIALTLLIAGTVAGFTILRLRQRGTKSFAVDQVMIRCHQLIKQLAANTANIKTP